MAHRRITPEEEHERLAERIWSNKENPIRDFKDFEKEIENYFDQVKLSDAQEHSLKPKTYEKLRENHPSLRPVGIAKLGKPKVIRVKKRKIKFPYLASKKGQIVFARRIKTKRGDRFIDRKGQFVTTKRKIPTRESLKFEGF